MSTNGYVSFGRAVTDFECQQKICSYILAPFWADFDIRCGGEVVYTSVNHSSDNWMLNRVNTVINDADFRGTWMLVVQWNEVPLYTQQADMCSSQHVSVLVCALYEQNFGLVPRPSHYEYCCKRVKFNITLGKAFHGDPKVIYLFHNSTHSMQEGLGMRLQN